MDMKGLVTCEDEFGHQARSVRMARLCKITQNSMAPLSS